MGMEAGNIAKMAGSTTGTGTVTVTGAVTGWLTFAQAGMKDGARATFLFENGNDREVSDGVWNATAGTVTRDQVLSSTNGNALVSFAAAPTVSVVDRFGNYAPAHPGFKSGRYYAPPGKFANYGVDFQALSFAPVWIPERVSITSLVVRVQGVGSAGNTIRAFIYANQGGNVFRPGAKIAETATAASDSVTVNNKEMAITGGPVTLEPGLYWFGCQNSGGTPNLFCYDASAYAMYENSWWMGATSLANAMGSTDIPQGLQYNGLGTGTLGSLAATSPSVDPASQKVPYVGFKVA